MRARAKTTDRSDFAPLPLEVEWAEGDTDVPDAEIQHGRVRTGGIDIPILLASAALLLGLYSVTRSAETVDAQQVAPVAESPEFLCPEGRALRGITRHGTAICTDISPADDPEPPSPLAATTEISYDWCYRTDVIGPSASDSGCTAALDLEQLQKQLFDGTR